MRFYLKILIMTILIAGIAGSAMSEVIVVPRDYGYIGEAVRNAQADDTVLVRAGNYRLVGDNWDNLKVNVRSGVTIIGESGPAQTIIDAENAADTTGFTLNSDAVVEGFTFTRFTHNPILISNAARARVTNCFFYANVNRSNNMGGQLRIIGSQDAIIEHCIFQENACGSAGSGIQLNSTSVRIKVWDCIFDRNESSKFGGGIAVISNSTIDVGNCIFTGNFVQVDGGGMSFSLSSSGTVHNCTFINNSARNGGGGGLYKGSSSNPTVINSVFWENDAGTGNNLWQQNTPPGNGGSITISYCCIQGGVEDDGGYNGQNIIEDSPWFAEGREPLWGLNFFYLDPEESSCIDAGSAAAREVGMDTLITNPDLSFDQGQVDLGFHYDMDSYLRLGSLRGTVLSALTGEGVWNCTISTQGRMQTIADQDGSWRIADYPRGNLWVNFHHEAFLDTTVGGLFVEEDEETVVDVQLLHTEFTPSIQEYVANIDSGNINQTQFNVQNGGSGVLTYTATPQLVGDANRQPWDLRASLQVGQTADDARCNGTVFLDSMFWVSGANDNDPNLIYVFDLEGGLIDSFEQTQNQRYGIKNMTAVGPDIYAAEGDSVVVYNRQGEVINAFETAVDPIEMIAYDPERDLIWLAGITSSFKAVTRGGEVTEYNIPNFQNHRKYALAYWPGDPDGKGLYYVNRLTVNGEPYRHLVYKFNPDDPQDTIFVAELFGEANPQYQGAQIVKWDLFSLTFITLANVFPANGGDRIDIFQFAGNTSWMLIEPNRGEIPPSDQQDFTLTLDLAGFPTGEYQSQLFFTHNALDNQWILPMLINLRPNVVLTGETPLPVTPEITAIHPNPFNGMTTLKYSIPSSGMVNISVYDLAGRQVGTLLDEPALAGNHTLSVDGEGWSSGVYIVKLETAGSAKTAKLVLMR